MLGGLGQVTRTSRLLCYRKLLPLSRRRKPRLGEERDLMAGGGRVGVQLRQLPDPASPWPRVAHHGSVPTAEDGASPGPTEHGRLLWPLGHCSSKSHSEERPVLPLPHVGPAGRRLQPCQASAGHGRRPEGKVLPCCSHGGGAPADTAEVTGHLVCHRGAASALPVQSGTPRPVFRHVMRGDSHTGRAPHPSHKGGGEACSPESSRLSREAPAQATPAWRPFLPSDGQHP